MLTGAYTRGSNSGSRKPIHGKVLYTRADRFRNWYPTIRTITMMTAIRISQNNLRLVCIKEVSLLVGEVPGCPGADSDRFILSQRLVVVKSNRQGNPPHQRQRCGLGIPAGVYRLQVLSRSGCGSAGSWYQWLSLWLFLKNLIPDATGQAPAPMPVRRFACAGLYPGPPRSGNQLVAVLRIVDIIQPGYIQHQERAGPVRTVIRS